MMMIMKNIKTFLIAAAAVFAISSCNLDKFPDNAINTEDAMESVADCEAFRNGLYSGMKYCFTGGFVYNTDIQTDLYHAVKNFGNFSGSWYTYTVTASESMASSAWYGLYGYIANANFLIEGTKKLLAAGTLNDEDTALVQQIYGEACYIRAHMYYQLANYYCVDYDPDTAEDYMGVPVVLKYEPTGDSSKYPARPNLQETYDQIVSDLDEAETYVLTAGTPNSAYVTADVVAALQARVALTMHDYDTALLKAKSIIDGGKYRLVSDAQAFASGWLNDTLTETIWQVAMTGPDDLGNAYSYFIYNTSGKVGEDSPRFVPEDWVLDLYAKNDIRYQAWFSNRDITTPVVGNLTLLVKYPGNPKLYSAVTNYVNMPKVFRVSEMYLIAAEAAANRGEDIVASKYLNDLKAARIPDWERRDYTGDNLTVAIRNERVIELYGEGHRLNDIKRWHIGFQRSAGQNPELVMSGDNYSGLKREADDPLFVWPIPTSEMQANPQMKQNPGYTNE